MKVVFTEDALRELDEILDTFQRRDVRLTQPDRADCRSWVAFESAGKGRI